MAKVADKFGRIRVDGVHYSVPIEHAYRPVTCKLFHDRVVVAVADQVVSEHVRSFRPGTKVIEPRHVLRLLERKHRAVNESTALQGWELPAVFHQLRSRLHEQVRKPDREWIAVLRLLEDHAEETVAHAVGESMERGTPRFESIRLLLRQSADVTSPAPRPAPVAPPGIAALTVDEPVLSDYDLLTSLGA
jgi:hypothetical protein